MIRVILALAVLTGLVACGSSAPVQREALSPCEQQRYDYTDLATPTNIVNDDALDDDDDIENGCVTMKFTVEIDGSISGVEVVTAHPDTYFIDNYIDDFKQWTFRTSNNRGALVRQTDRYYIIEHDLRR